MGQPGRRCAADAWQAHEAELRHFLLGQTHDAALADDLLQEAFVKALRAGSHFCDLENPRAWLFTVVRNGLIDHHRLQKATVPAVDRLPQALSEARPVDALSDCLEEALQALASDDRDVIQRCDIDGQPQRGYAEDQGLTLAAVKARIRRARVRLRAQLVARCGVRFDPSGQVCCHGPFGFSR